MTARTAELMAGIDFDVHRLEKAKLPFAPVNTPADPHLQAIGMIRRVEAPDGRRAQIAGLPLASDAWFKGAMTNPPASGRDTEEILANLGSR